MCMIGDLARSWTLLVWVAEKRRVCLCEGREETMELMAVEKPRSRHLDSGHIV